MRNSKAAPGTPDTHCTTFATLTKPGTGCRARERAHASGRGFNRARTSGGRAFQAIGRTSSCADGQGAPTGARGGAIKATRCSSPRRTH